MTFRERVFRVVSKIPRGLTLTYKEVARRASKPRAYRAVGNILNKNDNPKIPCHRVVKSDGSLGGYNRGVRKKRQYLFNEGVGALLSS
ncbi:MAG TPA: MGMT family protein [Candidatus Paceibacterota bacterium]